MRRILLLITDLKIGGTPTVVRELAIRLSAVGGVHIEVACLAPWGPVADQIARAGIGITALDGASALGLPIVLWRLRRLIRTKQIDTVFSFLVHANMVAAAVSPICRGVRFFQSIQTTQPYPRWHWIVQRFIERVAERIVVPSESVAGAAREWAHVPDRKIDVIPNAVDVEYLSRPCLAAPLAGRVAGVDADAQHENAPQAGPLIDRVKIRMLNADPMTHRPVGSALRTGSLVVETTVRSADPTKHQAIGFIGRLDPIKRVPDLIEALRLFDPEFHLNIFGEGAERSTIEQAIARLNLTNRVTLHGAINDPAEALRQMNLLVLPSQAEGFGLVLIEAMAAGVPVVATDVPGIRDVVKHGETGLLVPVASPEKLADAIRKLLADAALRERLTSNARQDVRRRFSWDIVLPMYQKALGISG